MRTPIKGRIPSTLRDALENQIQFAGHFNHEKTFESHAAGIKPQIHEFLVFVTVADETGFRVFQKGKGRDQFGLAPRLQAVVVFASETGNGLHHLLLLVDLYGVNRPVLPSVAVLTNGGGKTVVQFLDLGMQNIFNAQQHRHIVAPVQ